MQNSIGRKKIILIAVAGILVGLLSGAYIFSSVTHTSFSSLFSTADSKSTTGVLTTEPSSYPTSTVIETTTTTTTQSNPSHTNPTSLVLPDQSQYVEKYDAEIWSEEIGYDEYINMRYGPSKDNYDVIKKVQNGTYAEGLTDSVNGWVLVEVEGTKGWVRDDLVIHGGGGIAKPVLYLYPENTIDVSVKLALKDSTFSCTYPDYGKGWNVKAYPSGKLINKTDKREYSYLYWELDSDMKFDFSKGFVVRGKDTAAFLQKTLAEMGLKPKEYNEFIVYWLPQMQNNEYNLISFQSATYTDNVKLKIAPEPDSVLRVNMAYKPLTAKQAAKAKKTLKPQTFPKFERKGFTVVEWGGEEIS